MKRVQALLEGNEHFRKGYFRKHETQLLDLVANGQDPKALFIGCADSRVLPDLITSSPPGSLFVLRNVGNFVAPYKPDEDFHAMAAGIEYAVNALEVSEIIVCGHTHCGAIAALYEEGGLDDAKFPHTKKWLSLGNTAKTMASLALGADTDKKTLQELTERLSVVFQIENLLTYPYVRERVDEGTLHLHGWIYNVETGEIEYYDPDQCQYQRLKDLRAAEQNG